MRGDEIHFNDPPQKLHCVFLHSSIVKIMLNMTDTGGVPVSPGLIELTFVNVSLHTFINYSLQT